LEKGVSYVALSMKKMKRHGGKSTRRLGSIVSSLLLIIASYGCSSEKTEAADNQRVSIDIVGVRIGMSPDEVQAILQREPGLKFSSKSQRNWPVLTMKAEGKTETVVVLFTETNSRAWFIGRSLEIPAGERPLREDMARRVIEKYGEPVAHQSMKTPAATVVVWAWDKENRKIGKFGACTSRRGSSYWKPEFAREAPDAVLNSSYDPACDIYIEARVQGEIFDPNDRSSMPSLHGRHEIASGVSIAITSASLYRADPKNPIDSSIAREREKIDAAARAKPPRL
jgi:hypothetical protein